MINVLNDVFRSFFRTIGRILAYLAIGTLIAYLSGFLKPSSVKAANLTSWACEEDFKYPPRGYVFSLNSNYGYDDVTDYAAEPFYCGEKEYQRYSNTRSNLTYGTNGMMLSTTANVGLSTDTLYSFTFYACGNNDLPGTDYLDLYVNNSYYWTSNSKAKVYYKTFKTLGKQPYDNITFGDCDQITFIAQPTVNGLTAGIRLYGTGKNALALTLIGFDFTPLGNANGLTSSDIEKVISDSGLATATSVNEVKSAINEVKTEMSNLNETQKETNNLISSESEDTESSSCGIVCKLKGIFTGIIELPGKLVSLIIDALKSLFIPADSSFITNFVETIESKLGFIAEVPMAAINFILGLADASWNPLTSLTFPSLDIMGYQLWEDIAIDITPAINLLKPFKYLTDVACVVLCVMTLQKWRDRFTGGGE